MKISMDLTNNCGTMDSLAGRTRACNRATYFIESYGCQMNSHDSEKMAGILEELGYALSDNKAEADLIIFNTCCVREHAELRVFGNVGALKAVKDERPNTIIAVCGCMMQQREVAQRLYKRYPFVDIIFGTNELQKLPSMLAQAIQGERVMLINDDEHAIVPEGIPVKRTGAFSANINIMYGCDNFCTYCIVPYVRGRERSRDHNLIIEEAKELASRGYVELTLLGQNVNSYHSPKDNVNFPQLLRMLNDVNGIERIRFMTSHPKDLSAELILAMKSFSKVCNHVHLPVQSGSNRILRLMNRGYTHERYTEIVENLRLHVPGIEITTDIIVGFPGESEEDFKCTINLVKRVGFSAAYTFMYSPRKHTKAAVMDCQIPQEEKKRRLLELNKAIAEGLYSNNSKYIGRIENVLVEGSDVRSDTTYMYGKLTNFKTVYFAGSEALTGKLVRVRIDSVVHNSLSGTMV